MVKRRVADFEKIFGKGKEKKTTSVKSITFNEDEYLLRLVVKDNEIISVEIAKK